MPKKPAMPNVTEGHRRAAFEAMHWAGWTYEAAMANTTRRQIIDARAAHLRTAEFQRTATRTVSLVRRVSPSGNRWVTQRVPGAWQPEQMPLPGDGDC
jgi:hypothetical protein